MVEYASAFACRAPAIAGRLMRTCSLPLFGLSLLTACATAPQSGPHNADRANVDQERPDARKRPAFVVDDLLGAKAPAIDMLLGAPSLTRREGAGEFRRYALSQCTLILILYPDETGASEVAHVDATALDSDGEKPDLDACLAAG